MTATMKQLALTIPVQHGRLNPSPMQLLTIAGYLAGREGKAVVVKFTKPVTTRSQSQNRYLWGVVYEIIATESGHTPEEVHAVVKEMFLPRQFIRIGNHEAQIPKSTTELTTDEFELYLERIRVWAATELGFRIPLPNE